MNLCMFVSKYKRHSSREIGHLNSSAPMETVVGGLSLQILSYFTSPHSPLGFLTCPSSPEREFPNERRLKIKLKVDCHQLCREISKERNTIRLKVY